MSAIPQFGRWSASLTAVGPSAATVHVQMALGLRSLTLMDSDAEAQQRFAYAISAAMARKGWKGPDLARALELHPTAVHRWVKGETLPNILITKRLAAALDVKPEFLFDPPPIPDYPLSEYLVREATAEGVEEGMRPRRRRATGGGSDA